MRDWFRRQRRQWEDSFDRDRIVAQSHPRSLLGVLAIGLTCILVPARVEPIASAARMTHVWLPVVAYVAGVLASAGFWVLRGRGRWALALTFLDTAFMVTAVALCAALSSPPISYAYAALLALMLASVQAREYALSIPFALSCTIPPLLLPIAVPTDAMTMLLLAIATVVALWLSYNTRQMLAMRQERSQLVSALKASHEAVDAGVDLSLTSLLLDLGSFMHELRNAQSALECNLQYLLASGGDDAQAAEAIQDALEGHRRTTTLTNKFVQDLRERAMAPSAPFRLDESLRAQAKALSADVDVHVVEPLEPVSVKGDPSHIEEVLTRLVRNARKAGALNVSLTLDLAATHAVARLLVADDAPGRPPEDASDLFKPVFSTSPSEVVDLGLYLCRRRLELMGGTIALAETRSRGTAFDIRLPVYHGQLGEEVC